MTYHTLWECPRCKRANLSWRTVCVFCGWKLNETKDESEEPMNVLALAANWIEGSEGGDAKHDIAVKLRKLEEQAGELDNGLSQLIDEKCTDAMVAGAESSDWGDPSHHSGELASSCAHEITEAVTERIAAAFEAGQTAGGCKVCGECQFCEPREPEGQWCDRKGQQSVTTLMRVACVNNERREKQ